MTIRSIEDTYGSIPELMRIARGTYKRAVDQRLAANGFEDLPNPGGYLLAYLANDEQSIPDRIEGLGISTSMKSSSGGSPRLRWPVCAADSLSSGRSSSRSLVPPSVAVSQAR